MVERGRDRCRGSASGVYSISPAVGHAPSGHATEPRRTVVVGGERLGQRDSRCEFDARTGCGVRRGNPRCRRVAKPGRGKSRKVADLRQQWYCCGVRSHFNPWRGGGLFSLGGDHCVPYGVAGSQGRFSGGSDSDEVERPYSFLPAVVPQRIAVIFRRT